MAMNTATGAMMVISAGIDRLVTARNVRIVWRLAVSRSNSRKACVIQITAVNENRVARKAIATVLKT